MNKNFVDDIYVIKTALISLDERVETLENTKRYLCKVIFDGYAWTSSTFTGTVTFITKDAKLSEIVEDFAEYVTEITGQGGTPNPTDEAFANYIVALQNCVSCSGIVVDEQGNAYNVGKIDYTNLETMGLFAVVAYRYNGTEIVYDDLTGVTLFTNPANVTYEEYEL